MEGSELAWPHQHDLGMCVREQSQGKWTAVVRTGLGAHPPLAAWEKEKQHVRGRVAKKPGKPLLLLGNSAQDSRTWELG